MRKKIHPKYKPVTITCACGASFQTMSTRDSYSVDVCSSCHPFYTGDQKFIDTAGRVEKFQARFKNWDAEKTAAAARRAWEPLREAVAAVREGRVYPVLDRSLLIPGPGLPESVSLLVEMIHG